MHYGYVILFFSMLNLVGTLGFGRFAYTMILPTMRDALGLQNMDMGSIGTMGYLGYLAMTIPGGALAVRFGPRMVITFGLLLCGTGLVLMGTVSGIAGAFFFMLIIGFGSAAGNASGMAFTSTWFTGDSRGKATGITLAGAGLGMATVGMTIPIIISQYSTEGWRWAWYYSGGITILFGILCWRFLRNDPKEMNLRPVGAVPSNTVAQSRRFSHGWKGVVQSPAMWRLCAVTLTFGFVYVIYGTFFASFLQDEVGLSKVETGGLWSLVGILSIFSGFIGGWLSDRLGSTWAFTCLFACQGFALIVVSVSSAMIPLYLSIGLYALSLWGFPVLLAVSCIDLFGSRLAPAGVGFGIFFFSIGQALGPLVAGSLYDRTGSFMAPFLVGSAVTLFGILFAWYRPAPTYSQ